MHQNEKKRLDNCAATVLKIQKRVFVHKWDKYSITIRILPNRFDDYRYGTDSCAGKANNGEWVEGNSCINFIEVQLKCRNQNMGLNTLRRNQQS